MTSQNLSAHPISVISSFGSYRPSQKVKTNHSRSLLQDVLDELQNTLDQFDTLTDFAMTSYQVSEDVKMLKIQENARKSLVRSFLSVEFLEKYNSEIRKLDSNAIIEFIKETIGQDSKKKRCQKAIETLTDTTRNPEEKFVKFYARLKFISEDMVDADPAVKKYFIEKTFNENLTPMMRSFLLEQDSATKSIDEISKILDKCEKYRKTPNLNQISAETADLKIENLTKMIAALAEQNNSLTKQNDSMINLMKNKFADVDAELNKIKTSPKSNSNIQARSSQQKSPQTENQYPVWWELNQTGFPIRCQKCGYNGHRGSNCRGTRSSCNVCGKQGHIVYACPDRSNNTQQSSKN